MAYINQDKKKQIAADLKKRLKGYNVKYSLKVHHHSTLIMTVRSGDLDFLADAVREKFTEERIEQIREKMYVNVNPHWYQDHFTGRTLAFLREAFAALNDGNWDKSDIQTDYFNVGWYVDVRFGNWDKPYILNTVTA